MSDDRAVDLAALRAEYGDVGLDEARAGADPWHLWQRWFDEAAAAGIHEPNAMVVATVDPDGGPAARTVLLKGVGPDGFRFFTNTASRKGAALAEEPGCALLFPWHPLERQVRVDGVAVPLPAEDVAAYFASRPRGSQLGAWASPQSRVVAGRAELDARYREVEERFDGQDVPVPPEWGGYRVVPARFEFWQGRPGRMHDRLRYTATGDGWTIERLAP
ncbi:MAG TPA: pyridoxamine 5'-phosphate oxidase [Nocardioides sp.]|nr:pyridoxamine 5'-phosphate oxidase [Nocardioides sp.]